MSAEVFDGKAERIWKRGNEGEGVVFPMYIYLYIIKCKYLYKDSYRRGGGKKKKKGEKKNPIEYQYWFSSKIISTHRIIAVTVLLRLSGKVISYSLSFYLL